jgi:nucleotide-sensitive chloride channel 1A
LLTSKTRRVIWLSEAEKGKGYAVDFLAISLHAVSRDLEAYPSPCLYTQVIGQASSPPADTLVLVVELLPLEVQ